MLARDSTRSVLRSATGGHHQRVDRLFSTIDLTRRDGYGLFLTIMAQAHIAVEEALTAAGAAAILPDWAERRRAALLRDDLAALELPMPDTVEFAAFDSAAAMLGAAYVLEGSRLGGTLLSRSVPTEFPSRFLSAADSGAWRRLLAILDERLREDAERQIAVDAANDVFLLFERSGQQAMRTE